MVDGRVLSQDEIDSLFTRRQSHASKTPAAKAKPYDFRRPDRIAKDQLRAIQVLHENFARNLTSSLSAYLRAYVAVNLVSVEQLAFVEFTQPMVSPTCLVVLGLKPLDGQAVVELNPTLVFPVLEMLLGGVGRKFDGLDRKITEIEQSILDDLFRVILNDLRAAWEAVTPIEFSVESHETEATMLQIVGPSEAVVAIGLELHAGESVGMLNLGIPSVIVKLLAHKFDQSRSLSPRKATDQDQQKLFERLGSAALQMDVQLSGPSICFGTLLDLKEGDILTFNYPVNRHLDVLVNGSAKFRGEVIQAANMRAVQLLEQVADE